MEKQSFNNSEETELDINIKGGSFKEIVMSHLARIALLSSCELRGGYFTITTTKTGDTKQIYIGDSREAVSNAIYFLAQALLPKFDTEMDKSFNQFNIDIEKLKKVFLTKTKMDDDEVLGEGYYQEEEKPILEAYKIKKLNRYRDLFTELSKFLCRKKYLEITGGSF